MLADRTQFRLTSAHLTLINTTRTVLRGVFCHGLSHLSLTWSEALLCSDFRKTLNAASQPCWAFALLRLYIAFISFNIDTSLPKTPIRYFQLRHMVMFFKLNNRASWYLGSFPFFSPNAICRLTSHDVPNNSFYQTSYIEEFIFIDSHFTMTI